MNLTKKVIIIMMTAVETMEFTSAILLLMTLIWNTMTVPTEWLHATIKCLFKKGIRKLAANYRGISIGANMSRILAKIIIMRLKEAYEKSISEAQYKFRRNRSTNDGIFVVRNIIQKYNNTLIAVYIDLTAAYDHVPRDLSSFHEDRCSSSNCIIEKNVREYYCMYTLNRGQI